MKVECEKCRESFGYDNEYYLNEPVECPFCGHVNYVLDW